MTTTPYDWKREQLQAKSAKTLADLLLALKDACEELHRAIAEPPADTRYDGLRRLRSAQLPPGQLDPRD